jgi:hypothetical protein
MVMDVAAFAERYPRLWHMAEVENWALIQTQGLLSTSALLDLFGVMGSERQEIESAYRGEAVEIEHPTLGKATVRDQAPMHSDAVVARFLNDLTPAQWYRMLNSRVFFWLTEERLERLLGAGLYRSRSHMVLELDTAAVLERHIEQVTLSPINSGAIFAGGTTRRGRETFSRFGDYPWPRREKQKELVVELAVDRSVPDLSGLLINATERRAPAK